MALAYYAVVWITEALEDKFSSFFSSHPNPSGNLITGDLIADRNLMLYFQMNVLLPSISSLVKEGTPGTSKLSSAEYDQLDYSSC